MASRRGNQANHKVGTLTLDTPVYGDKVRFVCISDTHTYLEGNKNYVIPDGDVLLHAGDLTMYGKPDEVEIVNTFLGTLPHPYKVVIAGNHDMSFDLEFLKKDKKPLLWKLNNKDFHARLQAHGVTTVHEMMTNCIYMQDSAVEIYGIKIYGSPWTSGSEQWGFQTNVKTEIQAKWDQIPDNTDILLTHGPPCGYGGCMMRPSTKVKAFFGLAGEEEHVGCVELLDTVQHRVRPRFHVYGHIHKGYGMYTDGTTSYINAATCTGTFRPVNPPVIFDLPLPPGQHKMREVPPGTLQAMSYRPGSQLSS